MAQTIDVPPPQPKMLLQTAVVTHPEQAKYHLSWAEEAALAKQEIRVTCRVTARKVEYLHGHANRTVELLPDLRAHLQSMLRSQQLRQYDIECIGVLDDTGSKVTLLKSVSTGRVPIKQDAPPQAARIPTLNRSKSMDKVERAMTTLPRINMSAITFRHDDGQRYALSSEHTKFSCKVQFSTRPAAPGAPHRPPIGFSSGRVNGQEIDVETVVERLSNYSPAIYTYVKAQMGNSAADSFSFDAELDCTKITGQEKWVLQRWVEPMAIEINAQHLDVQRAEAQQAQQAQMQLAARRQAALRQAAARRGHNQPSNANQRRSPLAPAAAGVQQHRPTPAQGTLAQRRANQQRNARAVVHGAGRPSVAASSEAPNNIVTLRLQVELRRTSEGVWYPRCTLADGNIPGVRSVKVNQALGEWVAAAMQARDTLVTSSMFECRRLADGSFEAVKPVRTATRSSSDP